MLRRSEEAQPSPRKDVERVSDHLASTQSHFNPMENHAMDTLRKMIRIVALFASATAALAETALPEAA